MRMPYRTSLDLMILMEVFNQSKGSSNRVEQSLYKGQVAGSSPAP